MNPWLFVVNELSSSSADQTTVHWLSQVHGTGQAVAVCGIGDLDTAEDGSIHARVHAIPTGTPAEPATVLATARSTAITALPLADCGVVIVRTNPGRGAHIAAQDVGLQQLVMAADQGVAVLNAPAALMRARSKLFLSTLPAHTRPATLVSRDPATIRTFLERLGGRGILKPVLGTRGRDVFLVEPGTHTNLTQIIDVLVRDGYAMAQAFVPEASAGDVRMLLVNGDVLTVDGKPALVRRTPPSHDFRSNVAIGGTPVPAELTPGLAKLAADVGPLLRAAGLFLVGLDVIGDVIVEANVYAPGGFADAGRFGGVDFLPALTRAVHAHLEERT